MDDMRSVVEALVFASDSPVSVDRLKDVLGDVDRKAIVEILQDIETEYRQRRGGLCLMEVAGGYQFRTKAEFSPWIRKLRGIRPVALSPAAMETLSVVAYRQPVTRQEIEKIRGVDVSGSLKGLLEKKLVRIVGRKNVPGKPIMYGTTKRFLEVFDLKDLSELPTLREITEMEE
ncbi:MAG: SMC-Scp complex subunit ScpB [Syntrophaceae bacterium]|nr:SMC-Scp complex subunit ScpB [Syntrophaceae bacterium]